MTPARIRVRAAARQRRAATEQAILDATEGLLERTSFRDLTVEDVMDVAGLGRTAFYRYFPDLESVVLRHMDGIAEELHAASRAGCPRTIPTPSWSPRACASRRSTGITGASCRPSPRPPGPVPTSTTRGAASSTASSIPGVAHLEALMARGRAECAHPGETIRALSVLIDRYLLDTYGHSAEVDVAVPVAVLVQIWRRSLRLG